MTSSILLTLGIGLMALGLVTVILDIFKTIFRIKLIIWLVIAFVTVVALAMIGVLAI